MKTNFLFLALATILIFTWQISAAPFAGELDRSFNPTLGRTDLVRVNAIVAQPDGKFIVAGIFLKVNNIQVNSVARFNADGSLDTTFDAGGTVFGAVSTLALQPDGKVIVGGNFDSVGRQIRRRIARLNADGSFDATFAPPVQNSAGALAAIAVQTDGKILAYGASLFVGRDFARLNSDGSIDTSFTLTNAVVNSIAVQTDGKILICGESFTINNQTRVGVARLNADGTLDASFPNLAASSTVSKVAVLPNGKIMIGGIFNTISGQQYRRLARLNADGTIDTSFATATRNIAVRSFAVQSDGKVVYSGLNTPIYRDNADGTPDTAFVTRSRIFSNVDVVAALVDDRIVVGGRMLVSTVTPPSLSFTRYQPMALLAADGTLDDAVNHDIVYSDGTGTDILIQPDGKILFAEDYEQIFSPPFRHIVRINPNGSIDSTFTFATIPSTIIGTGALISQIAQQSDGKIVFGTTSNSSSMRNVFRVNADGSFDLAFNVTYSGGTGEIYRLEVLADDDVLIYGNFTQINGQPRTNFARLNADGSLDSFNPTLTAQVGTGTVNGFIVQADGKFYLSGGFVSVNGFSTTTVARFNLDGSVDTSFSNSSTFGQNQYYLLTAQADSKLLIGSLGSVVRLNANGSVDNSFTPPSFRAINGTSVSPVAAAIYPNGKILVGGGFYYVGDFIPRQGFARLNADGTLDQTYGTNGGTSATNNINTVQRIELQADGKAIISGRFQYVNNFSQYSLARLNQTATGANPISDFDGDGRSDFSVFRNGTWFINPSGASGFADAPNAAYGVQFGLSTDKLVPADYDGDGRIDVAVWRAGDFAYFYILNSSNSTFRAEQFGRTGDNPIVVGNWDADSKADLAVYRNAANAGEQSLFFYRPSSQPNVDFEIIYWGTSGNEAIRGDFDGDGKLDASVFRASNNLWYIRQSSNNQARYESWGTATDKRISGDFDADGKTDLAIFRDGLWAIRQSASNQQRYETFGQTGDKVAAGDYDGDGRTDLAIFRNGIFYVKQSGNSQSIAQSFGAADDIPIASAFVQ